MPDPVKQLEAMYLDGLEIETFERYPKCVGVTKGGCIALLEVTPGGLRMIGQPGWRMGEMMGVLVEVGGRKVFQAKGELADATPERLAELEGFRQKLEELLSPRA